MTEGGRSGCKCNLFEAILCGAMLWCCCLLPDYAIIGNHFHARLEQRAAKSLDTSMRLPACCLPASLGHLGTWLFVFQRKGKLHKSEQLNFFSLKISARSTHKKTARKYLPPPHKQTRRGSKSPRIDRK